MIDFTVGGLTVRLAGGSGAPARELEELEMARALVERFGGFVSAPGTAAADVTLDVSVAGDFSSEFHLESAELSLRIATARDGGRVILDGASHGWFDAGAGRGALTGATHLGEVDALVRLALAMSLPRRGALLMHGAAVALDEPSGSVTVLVGASGTGKSTAAAALGAGLGDELIVLHPSDDGLEASATPYWFGAPARRRVARLVCLARGGGGARTRLTGGAALRSVAPHLVRYVVDGEGDRAAFTLLATACSHVVVERFDCPEGAAFVPFLRAALAEEPSP